MFLVIEAGEELPVQGVHDQRELIALEVLTQVQTDLNAAAVAERGTDPARRRSHTAAAYDVDPANAADHIDSDVPVAASTRGSGARQRGPMGPTNGAVRVHRVPGTSKATAPKAGGKSCAKRGASVAVTGGGGPSTGTKQGRRTLSLEQLKDSPMKSPGTAPPVAKVRIFAFLACLNILQSRGVCSALSILFYPFCPNTCPQHPAMLYAGYAGKKNGAIWYKLCSCTCWSRGVSSSHC